MSIRNLIDDNDEFEYIDSDKVAMTDRDILIGVLKDVKYLKSSFESWKRESKESFEAFKEDVHERIRNSSSVDHEQRIRKLEKWMYGCLGAGAIIGAFVGWIVSLIKH